MKQVEMRLASLIAFYLRSEFLASRMDFYFLYLFSCFRGIPDIHKFED
jgi:hypothetical protein